MSSKTSRGQTVQTPGAEAGEDTGETQNPEGGGEPQATITPEMQAIIDAQVAAGVKAELRRRGAPVEQNSHLPTQAEALKQVNADPKRRAVLSRDGWVTTSKPLSKGKDDNGFEKA